MIKIENMSIDYGNGKGVSDINLNVSRGQVVGYLGPNGAGKTSTIRAIMGFIKPNSGSVTIDGLDSYKCADKIMAKLGYIAGEIAFERGLTAKAMLNYVVAMRKMSDKTKMNSLVERLELDMTGDINHFSKGMKQKLAIVIAFMHDPEILILDEPTSGLDPLMQNEFVKMVLEEKKAGKTILLSSHMFEEVERTADSVAIIKNGKIVSYDGVDELKSHQRKAFIITTAEKEKIFNSGFETEDCDGDRIKVFVPSQDIDKFIKLSSSVTIDGFEEVKQTLEQVFINYYKQP